MSMAMYLDQWLAKQSRSFVWPEKVNHEQNFWPSQTNVDCCSVFILTDDERGKVHGKQQIVFCEPQKAVGWDVALDAVSVQYAHITAYWWWWCGDAVRRPALERFFGVCI